MGLFRRKRRTAQEHNDGPVAQRHGEATDTCQEWSRALAENLDMLRDAFGPDEEVDIRRLDLNGRGFAVVAIDGLFDDKQLAQEVLRPLTLWAERHEDRRPSINDCREEILTAVQVSTIAAVTAAANSLFNGGALLLCDGDSEVLGVSVQGYAKRQPEQPTVESTIRGSKESLVETLQDNLAMLRRTVPDERLRVETRRVGSRTRTRVAVVYLRDVTDPDLVKEVLSRIERVKTDRILESRYLEERIQDHPWSIFPLLMDTERIDTIAGAVLDGKFVILIDRTPQALIAPVTFFDFFRHTGDYSAPPYFATFVRWIRFFAFLLSFTLLALYVAIVGFNPEVIPYKLALSILGTRYAVPFPAVFEVLVLDLMMEVLREATVRMPVHTGQTIGVVGGIILGTAVVQAGIVSNIMVIIVAMAAVSSFAIANYTFSRSVRVLKYALLVPAVFLGLVGYIGGIAFLIFHISSLDSFGVPYTSPLAPLHPRDIRDTLVRVPHSLSSGRPTTYHTSDAETVPSPDRPKT